MEHEQLKSSVKEAEARNRLAGSQAPKMGLALFFFLRFYFLEKDTRRSELLLPKTGEDASYFWVLAWGFSCLPHFDPESWIPAKSCCGRLFFFLGFSPRLTVLGELESALLVAGEKMYHKFGELPQQQRQGSRKRPSPGSPGVGLSFFFVVRAPSFGGFEGNQKDNALQVILEAPTRVF